MPRLISNEFHFIGIPTGWFDLPDHRILCAKFGIEGVMIWTKLYLSCFALNGYFAPMSPDHVCLAAVSHNVSEELVTDLLAFLAERDLIDGRLLAEEQILTSADIQHTFQEASKERGRKRTIDVTEEYWLLTADETAPFIRQIPLQSAHRKSASSNGEKTASKTKRTPPKPETTGKYSGSSVKNGHSSGKNKDSSPKKGDSSGRKERIGKEWNGQERIGLKEAPEVSPPKRRAVKLGRRMTGQSVNQRCEAVRRLYREICGDVLPPQKQVIPRIHLPLIRRGTLMGYTLRDYRAVFDAVHGSTFLRGENGGFRASFGWLIRPEKMAKVLAGEYADYARAAPGANQKEPAKGSFDTDDFFELALAHTEEAFLHSSPPSAEAWDFG